VLFSRRHPRYPNLSLPIPLRVRIFYILQERAAFDNWGNYDFAQAEYQYRKQLGLERIEAFAVDERKKRVPSDLEGVIKRGYANEVLDIVEAFLLVLDETEQEPCTREINEALQEHGQPWRLLNRQFVKLDSDYLAGEVLSTARSLLDDAGFAGPLAEFEDALRYHSTGETSAAINTANKALESTIKVVLGVDRAKPGRLIRAVIESELVPQYYQDFLTSFEDILRAVSVERNEPGRAHGQGSARTIIDPSLAELCMHLAGTLIVFLIKRYREKTSLDVGSMEVEDLPF